MPLESGAASRRQVVAIGRPTVPSEESGRAANVKFSVGGLDPRSVARYAFDKAQKGKMVIIPGAGMKIVKFFEHFLSEKALTRASYNVQSKKDGN